MPWIPPTQPIFPLNNIEKNHEIEKEKTENKYCQMRKYLCVSITMDICIRYSTKISMSITGCPGPFHVDLTENIEEAVYGLRFSDSMRVSSIRIYLNYNDTFMITDAESVECMTKTIHRELYDKMRRFFDNYIWRRNRTRAIYFNIEMDIKFNKKKNAKNIVYIVQGGMFVNYVIV
jgi:hypothetical protein